jgi:hypothetical protein
VGVSLWFGLEGMGFMGEGGRREACTSAVPLHSAMMHLEIRDVATEATAEVQ